MFGGHAAHVKSYLGWWADAGLLDTVSDAPRPWLTTAPLPAPAPHTAQAQPAVTSSAPTPDPAAVAAPPPARAALPDTLPAFDAWLATSSDLPGARWSPRRILPTGPQAAPIMLLADCPSESDIGAGRLFSGAVGDLLDAMLTAIGQSRDTLRVASVALTRPIAGRMDDRDREALTRIARHHIALVQPRALLLLGDRTARLLTGNGVGIDAQQRIFNHAGVTVPVHAIHHPRLLLEQPALKRPTWEVLKCLRDI